MVNNADVASVCVTYNPDLQKLAINIDNNRKQVERMFIVDNSDNCEIQSQISILCEKYHECCYVALGENRGIAFALNMGCSMAHSDGFEWILTLDQDSVMPYGFVEGYIRYCNSIDFGDYSKIGMLTCNMSTWNNRFEHGIEKITLCWTSGAFMRSKAYLQTGGFDTDLFIDGVDFDLCAKLLILGYEIVRINDLCLSHSLGNTKSIRILGHTLFYVTNHNPLRRYYMVRNGLYLSKKYSKELPSLKMGKSCLLKILLKIILFEKDKLKKIKAIGIGYSDYRKSKYGKCEHIL